MRSGVVGVALRDAMRCDAMQQRSIKKPTCPPPTWTHALVWGRLLILRFSTPQDTHSSNLSTYQSGRQQRFGHHAIANTTSRQRTRSTQQTGHGSAAHLPLKVNRSHGRHHKRGSSSSHQSASNTSTSTPTCADNNLKKSIPTQQVDKVARSQV